MDSSSSSSGGIASNERADDDVPESFSSGSEESDRPATSGLTKPLLAPRRPAEGRRENLLVSGDFRDLVAAAEEESRHALKDEGKALERQLGMPLSVVLQSVFRQDRACLSALIHMPWPEFLEVVRGMILALEAQYLSKEPSTPEADGEEKGHGNLLRLITVNSSTLWDQLGRSPLRAGVGRGAKGLFTARAAVSARLKAGNAANAAQDAAKRAQLTDDDWAIVSRLVIEEHALKRPKANGRTRSCIRALLKQKVGRPPSSGSIRRIIVSAEPRRHGSPAPVSHSQMQPSHEQHKSQLCQSMSQIILDGRQQHTHSRSKVVQLDSRARARLCQGFMTHLARWQQWRSGAAPCIESNAGVVAEARLQQANSHSSKGAPSSEVADAVDQSKHQLLLSSNTKDTPRQRLDPGTATRATSPPGGHLGSNLVRKVPSAEEAEVPVRPVFDPFIVPKTELGHSMRGIQNDSEETELQADSKRGCPDVSGCPIKATVVDNDKNETKLTFGFGMWSPGVSRTAPGSLAAFDHRDGKRHGQLPALESGVLPEVVSVSAVPQASRASMDLPDKWSKVPECGRAAPDAQVQGATFASGSVRAKATEGTSDVIGAPILAAKRTACCEASQRLTLAGKPWPKAWNQRSLQMEKYLLNFEERHLHDLFRDLSRPGTRETRPGTCEFRPGARENRSIELRPVTSQTTETSGSCALRARPSPQTTQGCVSVWPDLSWPGAGDGPAADGDTSPGRRPDSKTVGLPRLQTPRTPRTATAGTGPRSAHAESSISTADSWRHALLGPRGEQLPWARNGARKADPRGRASSAEVEESLHRGAARGGGLAALCGSLEKQEAPPGPFAEQADACLVPRPRSPGIPRRIPLRTPGCTPR